MSVSRSFTLRRLAGAMVLLVGLPLSSLGMTAAPAAATPGVTVTPFHNDAIGQATSIVSGPDGALWFATGHSPSTSLIGRMTTAGVVTATFTDPDLFGPDDLTVGPDGALWFSNAGALTIGRMTTAGSFTYFHDDSIQGVSGIAVGSDGNLWFANANFNTIGRITPTGTITDFPDPLIANPLGITAGPGGALWFTNASGWIGRITTSGTVTKFTDPNIVIPHYITAGPDGNLWFTNDRSIGRITPTGTVTAFPVGNTPVGLTRGPDGAIWFTIGGFGSTKPAVGRITTTGVMTTYTDPAIVALGAIAAGSDGAVWFKNAVNSIAKITVAPVVSPGIASVVEGGSGTVALQIPITLSVPSTQTVTAPWSTVFLSNGSTTQANPASDYTAASGTVTFAPGEVAKTITIDVNGDPLVEADEYIVVRVTNPTNAGLGGLFNLGVGFGVITNDDHATVLPGGASIIEGNSATASLAVPVTLSNPSTQTVTVQWMTGPAGPTPRADPATDFTAASGTVTFAPGETTKTVTIDVNGDTDVEPNEWIVIGFNHPTNAKVGGFYGLGFGVIVNDD